MSDEPEDGKNLDVPMRITIGLRGGRTVTFESNFSTLMGLTALLDSPDTEVVLLSNDPGEQPFFFRAARSDITDVVAHAHGGPKGWALLPPDVTASIVQLLMDVARNNSPQALPAGKLLVALRPLAGLA